MDLCWTLHFDDGCGREGIVITIMREIESEE